MAQTQLTFAEKYRPRTLEEIKGNSKEVGAIRDWALRWLKEPGRHLMVTGPSGVGKTSIAYALAASLGFEVFELNSSRARGQTGIGNELAIAGVSATLSGKPRLIFVDDVDTMGAADRGGLSVIQGLLATSLCPVYITSGAAYDQRLSELKAKVQVVDLRRISALTIKARLKEICKLEKLAEDEALLERIASNANGDLRSALNDLQGMNASSNRDAEQSVFNVLKAVFKTMNYSHAREALFSSETDHDTLKLWFEENIPVEYESPGEIAEAYSWLSKADMFDSRIIKRQYWGFLRYSNDLMACGIALSKKTTYRKFSPYQFPSFLRTMGRYRRDLALRRGVYKKLRLAFHGKDIEGDVALLKQMLAGLAGLAGLAASGESGKLAEAKKHYGLSDVELGYLTGLSESALAKKSAKKPDAITGAKASGGARKAKAKESKD